MEDKHKLMKRYWELVGQMRTLTNEAPDGRLPEARYSEYRSIEDEADAIAGRITIATGRAYGPQFTPDQNRVERLESRERWGKTSQTPGAGLEDTPDLERRGGSGAGGPFRSLGEQMQAVIRTQSPGGEPDRRLWEVRAPTGMGEGVGADGGFLVQHDMAAEIWRRVNETGQLLSRVTHVPISTNANAINHPYLKETARTAGNRYGGIQTYRKAEAATVTATKPALAEFKLELETGMALIYVSDELVSDAPQLDSFLRRVVPEAIRFHVEDELLNGNGVGRPLGILNAACLVTVAKEGGQTANTIKVENLAKMLARMHPASLPRAAWLFNVDVLPQLLTLTLGSGTSVVPVFLPGGNVAGRPFGTVYGLPALPIEHCATLGTVGDIILADLSQYVVIEKGGIDVASSIHVQFLYGEQVLRFSWRNNGAPGYSWAGGALTPAKGTNTQSPFIALATRS